MKTTLRPYYVMGGIIAALLTITAAAGVYDKGIYRPFLDENLVAFQFFQDALSLLLAPLLVIMMVRARGGSRRSLIIWIGILLYVSYYYAFYAFDFVYTVYYPLYLALMGLGIYSLVGLLVTIDVKDFEAHIGEGMPVRLVAIVLGMTGLFVPIWASMMAERIMTQQEGITDLVFVLDLSFLIPICLFAAVQIWRHHAVGYLLSGPLLFKAAVSGILLTGGEMLKIQLGVPPALDQLAVYLLLALVGLVGLVRFLSNIKEGVGEEMRAAAA